MKNRALQLCYEWCKEPKTLFVFVLARTVDDFHSFKGESITLYRRGKVLSENVMKVRVFPPFRPIFGGFIVALAPKYWGTWTASI